MWFIVMIQGALVSVAIGADWGADWVAWNASCFVISLALAIVNEVA